MSDEEITIHEESLRQMQKEMNELRKREQMLAERMSVFTARGTKNDASVHSPRKRNSRANKITFGLADIGKTAGNFENISQETNERSHRSSKHKNKESQEIRRSKSMTDKTVQHRRANVLEELQQLNLSQSKDRRARRKTQEYVGSNDEYVAKSQRTERSISVPNNDDDDEDTEGYLRSRSHRKMVQSSTDLESSQNSSYGKEIDLSRYVKSESNNDFENDDDDDDDDVYNEYNEDQNNPANGYQFDSGDGSKQRVKSGTKIILMSKEKEVEEYNTDSLIDLSSYDDEETNEYDTRRNGNERKHQKQDNEKSHSTRPQVSYNRYNDSQRQKYDIGIATKQPVDLYEDESTSSSEIDEPPIDIQTRIAEELRQQREREEEIRKAAGKSYSETGATSSDESESGALNTRPLSTHEKIEMEIAELTAREREFKATNNLSDNEESDEAADNNDSLSAMGKIEREIAEQKQREAEFKKQHLNDIRYYDQIYDDDNDDEDAEENHAQDNRQQTSNYDNYDEDSFSEEEPVYRTPKTITNRKPKREESFTFASRSIHDEIPVVQKLPRERLALKSTEQNQKETNAADLEVKKGLAKRRIKKFNSSTSINEIGRDKEGDRSKEIEVDIEIEKPKEKNNNDKATEGTVNFDDLINSGKKLVLKRKKSKSGTKPDIVRKENKSDEVTIQNVQVKLRRPIDEKRDGKKASSQPKRSSHPMVEVWERLHEEKELAEQRKQQEILKIKEKRKSLKQEIVPRVANKEEQDAKPSRKGNDSRVELRGKSRSIADKWNKRKSLVSDDTEANEGYGENIENGRNEKPAKPLKKTLKHIQKWEKMIESNKVQ